jgi:glycosyltransferase involved in cell wall biosynthesis
VKIVYVCSDNRDEIGFDKCYCRQLADAVNSTNRHSAEVLDLNDFAQSSAKARAACSDSDVIIIFRDLYGKVLNAIQHWKARDKTIIYHLDAGLDFLPATSSEYSFWMQGKREGVDETPIMDPPPITQLKWGMRLVNAAIVSSTRLLNDWQDYTLLHYLPRYFDMERYRNVNLVEHDEIIIGWGGGSTHIQGFQESGILTALKNVCRERPHVRILIVGSDKRIYNALQIPDSQKIFKSWIKPAEWPQVLSHVDIGIAPLSGEYDARRGWGRVVEYMIMKIPWVASNGAPYQELRDYGRLVRNSPETWTRTLLEMIDHIAIYKNEAQNDPFVFALSQGIEENIDKIIALYNQIHTKTLKGSKVYEI